MDSNKPSFSIIKIDYIPPSIVRQPPSPTAARKEGKMEPKMIGGNKRSTRTYYPRSCKRKRKRLTEIESLPEEVLFDVLVRLEAQDIYESARLACSKWYHMIHTHTFIYAHLQRSTYGLLIQSTFGDSFFMAVGESGRVEISKNRYKLRCPIKTSCNGLLLEFDRGSNSSPYFLNPASNYKLYVLNPATRQIFALPPFVGELIKYELFGIAYDADSMVYKAVVIAGSRKNVCYILTIGVDNSWRTVDSECLSSLATLHKTTPLITEGFVHWYNVVTNVVLTMNVETEIITETSGPNPENHLHTYLSTNPEYHRNTYLSTGRYLSLFRPCGDFCWEVWEMKPNIDYRWRKVCDISLKAHKCSTFQRFDITERVILVPLGWLKYPEVLVFGERARFWSQIFVFNLLTQEIVTIELPVRRCDYKIVVHKNSLVWLGGC
ncbi:hypothetical protein CASFOL_026451 [Castilleja foliolosa]|uniref:F-box domain-containing protein n=1 Tax=Castilleja foliolosa TaxID=1961234 RepID=A0ABD3CIX4_9LAMI